ncbi:MAG TPA: hypothetical protein VM122_07695 [Usitatibacter sp.]|nr:hypothetical protein [Usitatibacter sp.]
MHDDAMRRRELIRYLVASGALGAVGVSGWISQALASGDLPATPGVNRLEGTATVNGKPAKVGTPVEMGDRIATGTGSQAVIVLKGDAFLMRAQTVIEVQGREGVLSSLLVASGKVLSVFAKKPVAVKAAHATIGIRGTGAYLEVEPRSVYFCLCYGEAEVAGPGMAGVRNVKTEHHEQPLLLRDDGGVMRVEPGPFQNHSDDELVLLESLVGREPPFMKGGRYPLNKY